MYNREKERITLKMTVQDAICAVAEGNPGALSVCVRMMQEGGAIDPDAIMGGFTNILSFDTHRIYGARVWMLYKDVCGEDLARTIAVLRAMQLGFVSEGIVLTAIDNRGKGIDSGELLLKVQERLPEFAPITAEVDERLKEVAQEIAAVVGEKDGEPASPAHCPE